MYCVSATNGSPPLSPTLRQIRNENNRVSKELTNGDTFWVEEGRVASKAEVLVSMRCWTPELARLVEVDEAHLPGHVNR